MKFLFWNCCGTASAEGACDFIKMNSINPKRPTKIQVCMPNNPTKDIFFLNEQVISEKTEKEEKGNKEGQIQDK